MSNSNLSAVHNSSLDDAELVRRCERRVRMFPRYVHDFSILSADTTQSSAFPTSSISLMDGSGEALSVDSFLSSTMTSTDRQDSTVVANTSVNRNPYQDGRRWAGEGDWSYPTHNTHRHPSNKPATRARGCRASSKMSEAGQPPPPCLGSSDNDDGKDNERTHPESNNSSDSLPIIDNLILEPQCDFKNAAGAKAKPSRSSTRCPQFDPQRSIIYAWRGSSSHSCESKKHKQPKTTASRQPAGSKSYNVPKSTLDPSSETYLKKLDNILEKMSTKQDRHHPGQIEKMSLATRDAVSGSVNKVQKISPTSKLCTCSHKCGANNKLSMHDMIDEMKRTGQLRCRLGTKTDTAKQEKALAAGRPATRTRCPQKSGKRQMSESQETSTAACREPTRQYSLPTSSSQRSSGSQGHGRTRSKSLSALPRCHIQTLTSTSCTHKTYGKVHSCGATVNCRCSANLGKITRQQQEILKHIPNDITPDEIGALMKTVLSIVERRYSLKEPARGEGGSQGGLDDGTFTGVREDLSKYPVRGQSDSCNTQITLSSKPKMRYCYKTVDELSSQELLQTTLSSQSSRDEADMPSKDAGSRVETKAMNFGSLKVECLSSAPGLVSCSMPGDAKEDVRTCSLPLTSLKYSDSSSGSEYSSRTYNLSIGALGITGRCYKSKQSAVVLPFDDTVFPQQNKPARQDSGETCADRLVGPHTSPATDLPSETKQNLSSLHEDNADSTRHIGWKCPLQTERRNSLQLVDEDLGDGETWLSKDDQSNVVRSDSALSDGLLYVRPNSASRTVPHLGLADRSCTSHVVMPRNRSPQFGQRFHQRDGRNSTSLMVGTHETAGASWVLPPCPHEYNHSGCSQGDVLSNQKQCTALKDAELDKKIDDLRIQIQRSYRMPWSCTLQKDVPARQNQASSQTKTTSERQNSEARDDGNGPGDTTDLDALSCSVDTELTNTSISNRLQELDSEVASSLCCTWPSNPSLIQDGNMSLLRYLPGQCSLYGKHQDTTNATRALVHRREGANRIGDLTTDRFHQPSEMCGHKHGFQTFADTYAWQRNGITTEVSREAEHVIPDHAPPRLSHFCQADLDSTNVPFRRQDLLARTEPVRDQGENVLSAGDRSNLEGCRAASLGLSSRTLENLETFSPFDTTRRLNRNGSMPGSLIQQSRFHVSSTAELPTREDHHGSLNPRNSLEQAGLLKPSVGSEQPYSFKPDQSFELSDRMNVAASVKQPDNLKPITGVKPTDSLDPASSNAPRDNLNVYKSVTPPISGQQVSDLSTANNLQTPAQTDHPSLATESRQQGQANNNTPAAKCTRNAKVQSTSVRSSVRKTNLAQLKQHTESLLVEVCRRYCTDTLVPSLATSGGTDLESALEFIQNFSPISQVDVNTQYPVTISAQEKLLSTEIRNNEQASTGKSQQVTSEVVVSEGHVTGLPTSSSNNKNTFSGNKVQTCLVKSNFRQAKKSSRTVVSCNRMVRSVVKDMDRFAGQRPNHNSTGARLRQATIKKSFYEKAATPQIPTDSQNVHEKTESQDNETKPQKPHDNQTKSKMQYDGQTAQEKSVKSQIPCGSQPVLETARTCKKRARNKPANTGGDIVIVDVTSPQTSDLCSNEGGDKSPNQVSSNSVIMKKYSATSAMPVEVREISYSESDNSATHKEPAQNRPANRPTDRFESRNASLTSVKTDEKNTEHSQNDENTSCLETQPSDISQSCTIARLARAAAVARKMLASQMKHSHKTLSVADLSGTSDSFLETTTDSDLSLQDIQIEEALGCNYTDGSINASNNNNNLNNNYNNSNTPSSPVAHLLSSPITQSSLFVVLQLQICKWNQMLLCELVQMFLSEGLHNGVSIDALAIDVTETLDDNESSAMNRPCAKILGELAFQLERRILDYVFGMEGHKRRRFYGYTVNNICQMMNKESKNVCGSDDPLRKSELAFRLQKLLTGLKKVGYNIKVHGDFAQQIVNTYGLLPCPPDSSTIRDFGLHNANCIASLINHLACNDYEKENLHILLNSLKYLSKCDKRPLFVW